MRKYVKGDIIPSVEDMYKQKFIFHMDRLCPFGWFQNWQLRYVMNQLEMHRIFYAKLLDNSESE